MHDLQKLMAVRHSVTVQTFTEPQKLIYCLLPCVGCNTACRILPRNLPALGQCIVAARLCLAHGQALGSLMSVRCRYLLMSSTQGCASSRN